ncbi:MAG: hypothetical protein ACR2JI_05900 [Mycobacterium sp.]
MTNPREGRNWPRFILGGRMRTSTLVLILAFIGIGWLYETYEPPPSPPDQVPATEVVPPGFIPDPAYTWAPRTDVQRHTPTETTAETTPATTPGTTTSMTPPSTTEASPTTTPVTPTPSGEPASTSTPSSARPTTPVPPAPTP